MRIEEFAASVSSKEEFTEFLRRLLEDFESNPSLWQNREAGLLISALEAWISDSSGYYQSSGIDEKTLSEWRLISEAFLAARDYE